MSTIENKDPLLFTSDMLVPALSLEHGKWLINLNKIVVNYEK